MLQASTGITSIVVALLLTFRIVRALGPVRAMGVGLAATALAPLLIPLASPAAEIIRSLAVRLFARLHVVPPELLATHSAARAVVGPAVATLTYMLAAVGRNVTFTTTMILSKACAGDGPPGVAVGVNQGMDWRLNRRPRCLPCRMFSPMPTAHQRRSWFCCRLGSRMQPRRRTWAARRRVRQRPAPRMREA